MLFAAYKQHCSIFGNIISRPHWLYIMFNPIQLAVTKLTIASKKSLVFFIPSSDTFLIIRRKTSSAVVGLETWFLLGVMRQRAFYAVKFVFEISSLANLMAI